MANVDSAHTRAMMEYNARAKSTALGYILWFFLGFLGAHRLYGGRVGTGILQILLHGLGWLTAPIVIGYLFLGLWGLWWLVDAFLIPGWIRDYNLDVARRVGA
ncbi:TM2 domain-containing protein [Lutibaculum baratangense]|uniref:TM2 domain-containing protein n=1 Tax=Lutibaculum baratangense AMV1 TaxID=631454 RepID=V4TIQ0_9HYPH|nr:TM2 domain-containing protein [Lutibaculum baratangense]ESR25853.1 hypothetical protein N177_1188 [Lutibaculum baratangense AMV1]